MNKSVGNIDANRTEMLNGNLGWRLSSSDIVYYSKSYCPFVDNTRLAEKFDVL